jgi:hypothetical protein
MITDGEPTAHIEPDGNVFFNYPPVPETVEATLREVARCTRDGIRINTWNVNGALRFDADNITLPATRAIALADGTNLSPINTQAFDWEVELALVIGIKMAFFSDPVPKAVVAGEIANVFSNAPVASESPQPAKIETKLKESE